jgi:hypothetical protein
MSQRNTWIWLILAGGLFAFIFFFHNKGKKNETGPAKILPTLNPASVISVEVTPEDRVHIQAVRTNGTWQLLRPFSYAAPSARIEHLLSVLSQLVPKTFISQSEIKDRFNSDEEFGFANPQATLVITEPTHRSTIRIGRRTVPGDEVYLQIVGEAEGIYVVDADLLRAFPSKAGDWRDTTFARIKDVDFDTISVTNGSKGLELRRASSNSFWRLVSPTPARADNAKIDALLHELQMLQIQQFVTDEPKADLDSFGLATADLELVLSHGTNIIEDVQFGRVATNDPRQVYARHAGASTIVAVAAVPISPWKASNTDFRDPHLVTITEPVEVIEVVGTDSFSLIHQESNTWRIQPQNLPADAGLVKDLLASLAGMQVVQFVKDVVTEHDLPGYGLATPIRQYMLKSGTNAGPARTFAEISFGSSVEDRVYARRKDESFVYAMKRSDFERLSGSSWELRARQIWKLSVDAVAGATIEQNGQVRRILNKGDHSWVLAPGSQGTIEDLAVDQTLRGLCDLNAAFWTGRGQAARDKAGFTTNNIYKITLELKNGENRSVEFAGQSPSTFPYASATLDGEPWVFELPLKLCRDVMAYLSLPRTSP